MGTSRGQITFIISFNAHYNLYGVQAINHHFADPKSLCNVPLIECLLDPGFKPGVCDSSSQPDLFHVS